MLGLARALVLVSLDCSLVQQLMRSNLVLTSRQSQPAKSHARLYAVRRCLEVEATRGLQALPAPFEFAALIQ